MADLLAALSASPEQALANPRLALLFFLLVLWPLPWKGVALWRAAQARQRGWFLALFVLNTAAVLEILYLAFFQPKAARRPAAGKEKT